MPQVDAALFEELLRKRGPDLRYLKLRISNVVTKDGVEKDVIELVTRLCPELISCEVSLPGDFRRVDYVEYKNRRLNVHRLSEGNVTQLLSLFPKAKNIIIRGHEDEQLPPSLIRPSSGLLLKAKRSTASTCGPVSRVTL